MRDFTALNTTVVIRKQNLVLWINKLWQQKMWLLVEFNQISNFKCYQHFDFVFSYQLRHVVQATHESFKIQRFSLIKIQLY